MKLLTPEDVAQQLQVALGTVYNWSSQRRLPVVRLSRKVIRFRQEAIEKFVQQREDRAKRG